MKNLYDNNRHNRTDPLFLIPVVMGLIMACLPVVDYYCNWYITLFPVICIMSFRHTIEATRLCKFLVIALLYSLLSYWLIYRNTVFIDKLVNDIVLWIAGIYALSIMRRCTKTEKMLLLQVFSVLLLITAITTIIGLQQYPMASRQLASGSAIYNTEVYTKINIGGYDYIYGLVVFMPIQIWLIRNTNKLRKVLNMITIAVFGWVIIQSAYATALILSILLIVLSARGSTPKKTALFLTCFVLIVFFLKPLLISVLQFLIDNVAEEYVAGRLSIIIDLLNGKDAQEFANGSRIALLNRALRGFLHNPIFGNNLLAFNIKALSHHSTILDTLSSGGLLYFTAFISCFKAAFSVCGITKLKPCFFHVIVAAFILAILNPLSTQLIYMVLFVGGVCVYDLEMENPKQNSEDAEHPVIGNRIGM